MWTSIDLVAPSRPTKEVDVFQIFSSKSKDVNVTGVSESVKVVFVVEPAKILLTIALPVVDPSAEIITSEEVAEFVNVNMVEAL